MRRSIAAGAAVIVLILLVLGVRGCLNARKERAFKDYVRDVAALVQESDQLSEQLFGLLSDPGDQGEVDIENAFNQFRNASAQIVERVRATDHPDEMNGAHRFLIESVEFRRDGVADIADALPGALAQQDRREGTVQIAAQMQNFLASDVIYLRRVFPNIEAALKEEDLLGEEKIPQSQFLPDIDWLQPSTVSDRISRIRAGGGGRGPASPGLHGNGLGAVTLGGQTLNPGAAASIRLTGDLEMQVQVSNQGENTETDVTVRVTIGRGDEAVEATEQLDTIAAGETKPVTIQIAERPPTGEQLPIAVEVEPVPGEKKTDNNRGSFQAIFTR